VVQDFFHQQLANLNDPPSKPTLDLLEGIGVDAPELTAVKVQHLQSS